MEVTEMTNTNDNWDRLFEQLPLDATPGEDHREELRTRVLDQFDSQSSSPVTRSRLNHTVRTIMKYKIPQWTAAAAVLIVCAVWISQSYSPAIAADDVVAHIMNARTAQWDMIVKHEGSADVKIRVYLDPGHTRQEFETGMVVIVDFNKGQSLGLFADDKLAMTRPSAKMSGSAMKYDHFEKMRKELREAMADPDKNVEELGKQQFDGRTLVGFRFKPKTQTITIWADPDTAFPVRIETQLSGATKTTVVMVNYKCNIDLDPSLFSLEIPDGYSVRDENSPIPLIDHQDLIESLRMYCESSEGEFPAGLDIEATSKYIGYLAERNNTDQVQRSRDEQAQDLLRLYRGFAFATALAADEKWDAHYAGAGVKLGDTGRPIFWYKPADSEKYRVIYADLSVGEAGASPIVADAVRLAP
jgi:hypothetical protein